MKCSKLNGRYIDIVDYRVHIDAVLDMDIIYFYDV